MVINQTNQNAGNVNNGTPPSQADLERAAVDDAFQEQIRTAFGVLLDNIAQRRDDATTLFKNAVVIARVGYAAALEALGCANR